MDLTQYSVGTLVERAFRILNVYAPDEPIPDLDYKVGLQTFFEMMDKWALDHNTVYALQPKEFNLTPGKTVYTYGLGGDFSSERPIEIMTYGELDYGCYASQVIVRPYNMASYATNRYWTGGSDVWIEESYPKMKVHFANTDGAKSVVFFVKTALSVDSSGSIKRGEPTKDTSVSDTEAAKLKLNRTSAIQVPPGYLSTMLACLAVDLIPQYPTDLSPLTASTLINNADNLYKKIKRNNFVPEQMRDPRVTQSGYRDCGSGGGGGGGGGGPIIDPPAPEDKGNLFFNSERFYFDSGKAWFNGKVISRASYEAVFNNDAQGFQTGLAQYPAGEESQYTFVSGWASIPTPAGGASLGSGLKLSSINPDGEAQLFIKRRTTGLKPNTTFSMTGRMRIAVHEGLNCPSAKVWVKMGGSSLEPLTALETRTNKDDFFGINIDTGKHATAGNDVKTLGDLSTRDANCGNVPYEIKTFDLTNALTVKSDASGGVWLFGCTDSAYTGKTEVYVTEFKATLVEK